jgi:hypothetical protein
MTWLISQGENNLGMSNEPCGANADEAPECAKLTKDRWLWCLSAAAITYKLKSRRHARVARTRILEAFIRASPYDKVMKGARVNRWLVWCPRHELNVRPAV